MFWRFMSCSLCWITELNRVAKTCGDSGRFNEKQTVMIVFVHGQTRVRDSWIGPEVLATRNRDVNVDRSRDVSRIVLTGTGPFQSFQWFDQLTMSGISTATLRSRRLNRLARNRGICTF